MERKLKDYAVLMLKGMGMGAADVVPGVSGGTIAFIVGIYDELINSIKSINLESLKLFFSGKWAAFWKKINGNFLFFLLAGIGISVFHWLSSSPGYWWISRYWSGRSSSDWCWRLPGLYRKTSKSGRAGKPGWLLLLGRW